MISETAINRVRLYTGIVLFAYIAGHLTNTALGLVSLDAMNHGLTVALALWGGPVGQIALSGSFAVHFALALRALYRRRTWRMPASEAAQLALGFLIPLMLAAHFAGTRYLITNYDALPNYASVLRQLWVNDPANGWAQAALVVIAWSHGCIGINFNLRLRRWYPAARPYLLIVAVLVPVLALLGYFEAGRAVAALAQNPDWVAALAAATHTGDPHMMAAAEAFGTTMRGGVVLAIVLAVAARFARLSLGRRRGLVTITYPNGAAIRIAPGTSVLEASRLAGIPHASVCGGRGRCSTCRVRVSGAEAAVSAPAEDERAVLRRVGLPANVRLACRLRPAGDIAVVPLLAIDTAAEQMRHRARTGAERDIAVMFCDIRAFTRLAEHKLPYDVVFMLNRYFAEMGAAIEGAGGHVDKFVGDGVMGLFGIEAPLEEACRQALTAAADMSGRVTRLNEEWAADLPEGLRIGIGIHAGPVILGEMDGATP